MLFYLGTHVLSHAKWFERVFISVNRFRSNTKSGWRISDIQVNNWILDSGAFTELSNYGYYRFSVEEYAKQINRWCKCGRMEFAVSQDYMCESDILKTTGLTVVEHQVLTISRYDKLLGLSKAPILPVLQGYQPQEYVNHIELYKDRLKYGMRVGVGSVCKRNNNPKAIIDVLEAIKGKRPDLKLHGFGLKVTALQNAYISDLLYSADSMAWSLSARRNNGNRNGLLEAYNFLSDISDRQGIKPYQLELEKNYAKLSIN